MLNSIEITEVLRYELDTIAKLERAWFAKIPTLKNNKPNYTEMYNRTLNAVEMETLEETEEQEKRTLLPGPVMRQFISKRS